MLEAACERLQIFLGTFGDVGDCVTQADINDWLSALQSVEGAVQGSIATKQESCPEGAPRTETALEYGSIEDRIADATRDASESHKEDCNSYGAGYDSGYLAALIELRDDQLTKTPSAGHDDGNLRATGGEA